MLLSFLNPAKFPNLRATSSSVNEPTITISTVKPSFGLSMKLVRNLREIFPNFTQIQFAVGEVVKEDKTTELKYYIVPCDKGGWDVKFQPKAASAYFNSKGLNHKLLADWQMPESVNLIKVPVSETAQDLKGVKGLELKIDDKTFTLKTVKP